MKTLRMKVILGLAALALAVTALGAGTDGADLTRKVNEYEGQHLGRKVNEYEGQHLGRKVNEYEGQHLAKVNEYEGQHRSVTGDPSQWG